MKLRRRENLNYYLEELVWYNVCMKKGGLKSLPLFSKGKSMITVKKDFRVLKGCQIFNYFHKEGKKSVYPIGSKKKMWRVLMEFPSTEAERWLVYYLDEFFRSVKRKGLKARTFGISSDWVFLFKEIGELRLSDLYFDYYDWNSMWIVLLESRELEKLVYSSLKVKYSHASFN